MLFAGSYSRALEFLPLRQGGHGVCRQPLLKADALGQLLLGKPSEQPLPESLIQPVDGLDGRGGLRGEGQVDLPPVLPVLAAVSFLGLSWRKPRMVASRGASP